MAPDKSADRVAFVGAGYAVARRCPGYTCGTVGSLGDGCAVAVVVLLRWAIAGAWGASGASLLGSRVAVKCLAAHNVGWCGGAGQAKAACLLGAVAVIERFAVQHISTCDGAVWCPRGGSFDAVPASTPAWRVAVAPVAASL